MKIPRNVEPNCKVYSLNKAKVMRPKRKPYHRASNKRHTYNTIVGIEDLTAVVVDLLFRVNRMIAFSKTISKELDETEARINDAMEILRVVRTGPHNYPLDGNYKIKRTQVTRNETQGQRTRSNLQASKD
jgi:hypothetical protein